MNSRSFGLALRCSECAFQSAIRRNGGRAFTSSSVLNRHGAVPKFTDVSSPELETLLSDVRTKVIMPAHLSKSQQDLIYKQKHMKLLASEPVTAILGGEEFTLQHVDRTKGAIPKQRASLLEAMKLMKEKKDWDNLPNLLEGLSDAGLSIPLVSVMVIAFASRAGRQDTIVECLRRVEDTKFALDNARIASRCMLAMQLKAVNSDWDSKETRKALAWAEQIAMMMEDPKHSRNVVLGGPDDPRIQPQVLGALLQLAAVRALKFQDGKDDDGKVLQYAERLLSLPASFEGPKVPLLSEKGKTRRDTAKIRSTWLALHAPIWYGLTVARTILGASSPLSTKINATAKHLQGLIDTSVSKLTTEAPRSKSVELYQKLAKL